MSFAWVFLGPEAIARLIVDRRHTRERALPERSDMAEDLQGFMSDPKEAKYSRAGK